MPAQAALLPDRPDPQGPFNLRSARDLARDTAKTEAYQTSRCQRKKVEMLFAKLKRILRLDRLRVRGCRLSRPQLLRNRLVQHNR